MWKYFQFKKIINKPLFKTEYMHNGNLNAYTLCRHLINPELSVMSIKDIHILYSYFLSSMSDKITHLINHSDYNCKQNIQQTLLFAIQNRNYK
jgi:hypothetical protein